MMELMVDLGQRAYPIRIREGGVGPPRAGAQTTQGNESAFGDQYHRRTAL